MRFVIIYILVLFFGSHARCFAQNAAVQPYHMESAPARHIRATLVDTWKTPEDTPRQWAVYIPLPPTYSGQSQVTTQLSLKGLQAEQGQTKELSPLQRPVLWALASAPKQQTQKSLTTTVMYEATLYARRIVPGVGTVVALSTSEQTSNLNTSETLDFRSPPFQLWLDKTHLRRIASERDLDFAFRVYQTIRKLYHYNYDPMQDRKASQICQTNQSDCGGLSYLFVSTLRANGVPAHALAGRLAKSSLKPQDYGSCHVRSEFYSNGVGWVPVDMSFGVGASDENAIMYFGNDPGDLLVMHQDNDLIIEQKPFGSHSYYVMQKLVHYVWGTGSLNGNHDTDDWIVEDLPLLPPSASPLAPSPISPSPARP